MIRTSVVAAALMVIATPALSLSCLRPDVARSYGYAVEAEESYLVVHGTLTFNDIKLPKSLGNDRPPSTKIRAHLKGKALSQSGFDHAFDRDVVLEVLCFGPWCGGANSGTSYLGFIKKEGSQYVFAVDPCGSFSFAEPTPKMLRKAKQCMNGRSCKPDAN